MTNSPKVTVILPTHNRASLLQQAIDSIRQQTLTDWELIIIDDASGDSTPEMVRAWTQQDPRIHYYRHNTNQGAAAARNTGLMHARGTYVAFQDDDDVSHPERLHRQADYLDKHPHIALLYTPLVYFHGSAPPRLRVYRRKSDSSEVFATLMGHRVLYQNVQFRPFFRSKEDPDFCLRVGERREASAVLPDALYAVRQGRHNRRSSIPHQTIYYALVVVSAAHRRHRLPDPIDKARRLSDAIANIHQGFPRIVEETPALAEAITHSLAQDALQAFLDELPASPYRHALVQRCFPLQRRRAVLSALRDNPVFFPMLKRHLYDAIRYKDKDAFLRGLAALHTLLDEPQRRALARKMLVACLKRGRLTFIPLLVRRANATISTSTRCVRKIRLF